MADLICARFSAFFHISAIIVCFNLFSPLSDAHPQCLDFLPPFGVESGSQLEFCTEYSEFGCCTIEKDEELQDHYSQLIDSIPASSRATCEEYIRQILCQECSPYAAHVFDAETDEQKSALPGLCGDYCLGFYDVCQEVVPYLTTDETILGSLDSRENFCQAVEIGDVDYCYPDVDSNQDLSQQLNRSYYGGEGCICFEEFANSIPNPVFAVHANDTTHRLFIGEQIGTIYVFLRNKTRVDTPFLDIRDSVLTSSKKGDERGLLGLAFHPDFKSNGRAYVYYSVTSDSEHKIRISEFRQSADNVNLLNVSTERIVLEVSEPAGNHEGGQLLFGLDGYLYAFIGDGGKGGDPFGEIGNGQNLETLLGSVVRLDVDSVTSDTPYAIPPDNPFLNQPQARPEIYAYGVRNMWRCSVDRGDEEGYGRGRIFCGDVGQSSYEEVDIIYKGGNYGWRGKEGYECYDDDLCHSLESEILPIHAYSHSVGKSVIGGYMYRGCESPNLQGHYIYGDYHNGKLFKLTETSQGSNQWDNTDLCLGDETICINGLTNSYPKNILSFGEDEGGEVYLLSTDYASTTHSGGKVLKVVDPSRRGNPDDCNFENSNVEIIGSTSDFAPSTGISPTTISTDLEGSESLWRSMPGCLSLLLLTLTLTYLFTVSQTHGLVPTAVQAEL